MTSKLRITLIAVAGLISFFQSAQTHAVSSAASCVKATRGSGDKVELQNTCSVIVSLPYCRLDKPMGGLKCGQQESKNNHNPYYTHIKILRAGEKSTLFGQFVYGVCPGLLEGSGGTVGLLDSHPDGAYTCWPGTPASTGAASQNKVTISATGRDLTETCNSARIAPSSDLQDPTGCTCIPITNTGGKELAYKCSADYTSSSGSGGTNLKSVVRDAIQKELRDFCAAYPDARACVPGGKDGGSGIRG